MVTALLTCSLLASSGTASGPTAGDYLAAGALVEGNLLALLANEDVTPNWVESDGKAGFWFQRDGDQGPELAFFDLEAKAREPAFDHDRIGAAISKALETAGAARDDGQTGLAGLASLRLSADLETLTATSGHLSVTCTINEAACEAEPLTPPEPGLLPSPDQRLAALARADDLYVRTLTTGEEKRLTYDGKPYFSYGKWPDTSLITVTIQKTGMKLPPYQSSWSPDSRYLLVPRVDERVLESVPFVEWVPTDGSRRPEVYEVREPLVGEEDTMGLDWFIFDTETGSRAKVDFSSALDESVGTASLGGGIIGWDIERGHLYFLVSGYAGKSSTLVAADVATGRCEAIVREDAETRAEANTHLYNRPNVRLVRGPNDERRVIWYSDRTGWGHLYLYEIGEPGEGSDLLGTVTAGSWAVLDVITIDEDGQQVYFTGGGREQGRNPYHRHLYRASLDPNKLSSAPKAILLTSEDADHQFEPDPVLMFRTLFGVPSPPPRIRPDLGVLIDTYSTVSDPPVTVLRSIEDGRVLAEIDRADASALFEAGYVVPERREFLAADGKTRVSSIYFAPQRTVEGGKHPVIDASYGGPQVHVAPRNFIQAVGSRNPIGEPALARLGFAVVVTDGRGTPARSSAFRDAGYPEFTQVGIEDHVAVIKQWAELKPEIDLERVGVYGWSWGGTFAAQAILSRPDFYDVSVSGAGVYDYAANYPGFEFVTGPPVYEDGSNIKGRPDESPKSWEALDITKMADRLEGRLLIVYGDMDENVPPTQAFRLVDALVKANKPYDLLYLPNRTHGGGGEPYTILRTWDYFVEHLMGAEPPRDVMFEIKPAPAIF